MQIVKYRDPSGIARVGFLSDGMIHPIRGDDAPGALTALLERLSDSGDPRGEVDARGEPVSLDRVRLLAPIDAHEVWGAGVTYLRSKQAREEESETAASVYDLVYQADRPELFLKATPQRVVGPDEPIRVRHDSTWTVPEPELALVLTSRLKLVGFTLGNDVSARDIEGRNPLYLPQAKVYDACCALGPAITLAADLPEPGSLEIVLRVRRAGAIAFEGVSSVGRMVRRFDELIGWLGRDNTFSAGAVLLTGTGIVPPDEFQLRGGDLVEIEAEGIGRLSNPAAQGSVPAGTAC
jgi:2-dehydro-3-deoxy-D-arabinonate dehydratase